MVQKHSVSFLVSYNCCQTTCEHFLTGIILVIVSGREGIGIHLYVQKIISNSLQSTFMFIIIFFYKAMCSVWRLRQRPCET